MNKTSQIRSLLHYLRVSERKSENSSQTWDETLLRSRVSQELALEFEDTLFVKIQLTMNTQRNGADALLETLKYHGGVDTVF